jgi:hypothetical protein
MSVEVAQTAKAIATELAMRRAQRVAEVEQFVMSRVPGLAIGGHGFGAGGGPGGGISGIMRETLVIFRELGRGNFTRIPGSVTLLAQYMGVLGVVIKSSAQETVKAAMASGELAVKMGIASMAAEVKAKASYDAMVAEELDGGASLRLADADEQQAVAATEAALAQKLKAEADEKAARVALFSAKNSLLAAGWIAIALIAVGVAAYFVWRHFQNLAKAEKNLKDLTDNTTKSFEDQAKQLKEAGEAQQAYIDKQKEQAESEKGVKDAIDETLKAMREKAQMERELASAGGATHTQVAQMEIADMKAELEYLKQTKTAQEAKIAADKEAQNAAAEKASGFKFSMGETGAGALKRALKNADDSATVVDKIREAMKGAFVTEVDLSGAMGNPNAQNKHRNAGPGDILPGVKVGDRQYPAMSLDQAMEAHNKEAGAAIVLANMEKEYADTLSKKEKLTDADIERLNKLGSDIGELETSLGLKSTLGLKVAGAQDAKSKQRLTESASDSLMRVGNFLGSSRGQMETLAHAAHRVAVEHLQVSKQIERHLGDIKRKTPGENHFNGTGGG